MVATSHFLPAPTSARRQIHQREIKLQAFARDDDLYDLEALIEDVKPEPFAAATQTFPAGVPIHLMALRLTVNKEFTILQVQASMHKTPFQKICPSATDGMQRLVGCNLLKGFRRAVSERLPSGERCTHLAELATLMPTLAVQALIQGAPGANAQPASDQRPLKIDGCHAWRADGPLTQEYLPQWYTGAQCASEVSAKVSAANSQLSTPDAHD